MARAIAFQTGWIIATNDGVARNVVTVCRDAKGYGDWGSSGIWKKKKNGESTIVCVFQEDYWMVAASR